MLFVHYILWGNWLENHMLQCPFVKYLHIECPGCGMQRSLIALCRGDIASSFALYPALIPLFVLLAYTILHLFYKFANGPKIIISAQIIVVSTVVVHYIYKIIHHTVFH